MLATNNRNYLIALCVLIGGYLAIYFNSSLIDGFTASLLDMRSEYTAVEQLSKFCLIVAMLCCLYAFNTAERLYTAKATASLLALAITMYLSESNMIREKYQPIFGAILILPTAYWLLRSGQWLALLLFSSGIGIAASGSLHDLLQESEQVQAWVPEFISSFLLSFNEEQVDTVGIGILSLAAVVLARTSIVSYLNIGIPQFVAVLLAVGLVAISNGLAHYQYDPSTTLLIVSAAMSLLGLFIYFYTAHKAPFDYHLAAVNRKILYSLALFIFFVLPIFWTEYNNSTAVLFWLMAIGAARKLYVATVERQQLSA